jgi:hypothetical protein
MDTSKSEFYHFGLLPAVCIHCLIEDEYSIMYKPQEICECGHSEWIESTMIKFISLIPSNVHRCKKCNEVRIAHHIGIIDE